jgi:hypothetical protein
MEKRNVDSTNNPRRNESYSHGSNKNDRPEES